VKAPTVVAELRRGYRMPRPPCYAGHWSKSRCGEEKPGPGSLGKRRKIAARKVPPSEKALGRLPATYNSPSF